MSTSDFDFEPVRGLPQLLPKGERMIWQGGPTFKTLAIRAFKIRAIAIYFAVLIAWRIGTGIAGGVSAGQMLPSLTWMTGLAGLALGTLALLAWASARSTVYTITSERVVMRYGIALPITLNLPFSRMAGASLRVESDGSGDIPLQLSKGERIAYLVLWPHARPRHYAKPEPMLRAIPDAKAVADKLAAAMVAAEQRAAKTAAARAAVSSAANDAGEPKPTATVEAAE